MIVLGIASCRGWSFCAKVAAHQQTKLSQFTRRHNSMLAWKVCDSYNNPNKTTFDSKLECVETRLPPISKPSDVLVKVHASSINPLDLRMVYGYGRRVLDLLDLATNFEPRITNDRYPLTLGRDFSGEVVAAGPYAKDFKPGDLVFGAVEPQRSGAHAQYVTVSSSCLVKKPKNLKSVEAASIPFTALTAYSALCSFGHLSEDNCSNKNILVIGGSGGVGSFAIQLLKLWGASVVATCSDEKIDWLENTLFVDQAISYNDPAQIDNLHGKFDFVLDCGNYEQTFLSHNEIVENSLKYLKPRNQGIYVTLSPPILNNTDKHGIVLGSAETVLQAAYDTFVGLSNMNSARWAVFLPNKAALEHVSNLYEDEAITPHVDSVFSFDEIPRAFERLRDGKVKGKVVVDVLNLKSERKTSSAQSDQRESNNSPVS